MSKPKKGLGDIDTSALGDFAAENFPKTQPATRKTTKEKPARDQR